jgi:hypothetical protein
VVEKDARAGEGKGELGNCAPLSDPLAFDTLIKLEIPVHPTACVV